MFMSCSKQVFSETLRFKNGKGNNWNMLQYVCSCPIATFLFYLNAIHAVCTAKMLLDRTSQPGGHKEMSSILADH
jgi:hypothetical protein